MGRVLRSSLSQVLIVFAAGFSSWAVRVLWLEPQADWTYTAFIRNPNRLRRVTA